MNVALKSNEVWGQGKINSGLADFINQKMLNRKLIDIIPVTMKPSWSNGRAGEAYIAKRLDRVFVCVDIIDKIGMPCLSVENILISDHLPILLAWPDNLFRKGYSFKFDGGLLLDTAFNEFIRKEWEKIKAREKDFIYSTFREKLKELRNLIKQWQFRKHQKDKKDLQMIQQNLDALLASTDYSSVSFEMKNRIRFLEKEKLKLLSQEEARWRLKSRALWLEKGDKNTKKFHRYANARRARNFIWKIKDERTTQPPLRRKFLIWQWISLKKNTAGVMRLYSTIFYGL